LFLEAIHLPEGELFGVGKGSPDQNKLESPSAINYLPVASACSDRIALTDMSEKIDHRDALYLFACHLEWRTKRNLAAYQELLAALDDHDRDIRLLAESLLHRSSPRPERTATGIKSR